MGRCSFRFRPLGLGAGGFLLAAGLVGAGGARAASPPNDDAARATVVTGTAFSLVADLAGATREAFEPAGPNDFGQTVWWRWVAPESGVWAWDASGKSNAVSVTVLTRDDFDQWDVVTGTYLRPVEGIGGLFGGTRFVPDERGSFAARAGGTYWLRLDGIQNGGGLVIFPGRDPLAPYPVSVSFDRLAEPAPEHDSFAGRRPLDLAHPEFEGSLVAATSEPGEPKAHAEAEGRTLWWEWVAPARGTARIAITDPRQSPLLAVYRRTEWAVLETFGSSATEYGNECTRFWRARTSFEWDTTEGEAYAVQVDSFPDFDRALPFGARLEFTSAPANDVPATPTDVAGAEWGLLATNEGATHTPGEPVLPGQAGLSSVWFRWNLAGPGLVQVTTNEPTRFAEPGVEVLPPGGGGSAGGVFDWSAGPCSGPFEDLHPRPPYVPILGLFDRVGSSGERPLLQYRSHATNEIWSVVSGGELWIQMDGPEGATGSHPLQGRLTPPPSNDARAARIVLPSASVRVTGRTAGATLEPGEPLPVGMGEPRRSVWWEWTAPSAGLWVLRVRVGYYDNVFALYRSSAGNGTAPLATGGTPVVFSAAAGETFQLGVFNVAGWGGNVEFLVTEVSVPPLTPPVWTYDGAGGYSWVIGGLQGWDLPLKGETSADLRRWTPVEIHWLTGMDTLRVFLDPTAAAGFFRLRVDPEGN